MGSPSVTGSGQTEDEEGRYCSLTISLSVLLDISVTRQGENTEKLDAETNTANTGKTKI